MRIAKLAAIAAFACISAPVLAVPVSWNLESSVYRTNLPAFDIQIGDTLSIDAVVESDTRAYLNSPTDYGFFNPFSTFTLSVNGHALTLGPIFPENTIESRDSNWIGVQTFDDMQSLYMLAVMYDGDVAYRIEATLEFDGTSSLPVGVFPAEPPSLANLRLNELNLYQHLPNGAGIFIAGSQVTSFTTASVPEPGTLGLSLGVAGLLLIMGRRRKTAGC